MGFCGFCGVLWVLVTPIIIWKFELCRFDKIWTLFIYRFGFKTDVQNGENLNKQSPLLNMSHFTKILKKVVRFKNWFNVLQKKIHGRWQLKVSKSQKQFFLKLHCPKDEQNIRHNSHIWPPPVAIFLALRVWEAFGVS